MISCMISMKAERIFTIGSIITFFALLPALIYMEIRVLQMVPHIAYLFIIADILLLAFMGLEIFLLVRKWKKEKTAESEEENLDSEDSTEIHQEWDSTQEETKQN